MKRQSITPAGSAEIMGAYSHGLKVDVGDSEMIFVTGQIAQDKDGNVISDDIVEQTRYVFGQIKAILNEAGASMDDVIKAQLFLTDINDFAKVSPIRNEYFAGSRPVSTMVQIEALVKPGCKIEIEVTAVKEKS